MLLCGWTINSSIIRKLSTSENIIIKMEVEQYKANLDWSGALKKSGNALRLEWWDINQLTLNYYHLNLCTTYHHIQSVLIMQETILRLIIIYITNSEREDDNIDILSV